jgi:hypothetical protein
MTRLTPLVAVAVVLALVPACSNDKAAGNADDEPNLRLVESGPEWNWLPRPPLDMDWDGPPNAEVIAGGGHVEASSAAADEAALDELDLQSGARVQSDGEGNVWLLSLNTVFRIADDRVDRRHQFPDSRAIATSPDGRVAVTDRFAVEVFGPDRSDRQTIQNDSRLYGLTFDAEGNLLGGTESDADTAAQFHVIVFDDGEQRDLAIPAGRAPEAPLSRAVLLTTLSDGRVILASWEAEDEVTLWVLTDEQALPIGTDPAQARRQKITSLAPAPDGRLLVTTGEGIEVVDVDSGESDTLVDLQGAEGTFSATATGSDLIFLADGRLWRLPNALD